MTFSALSVKILEGGTQGAPLWMKPCKLKLLKTLSVDIDYLPLLWVKIAGHTVISAEVTIAPNYALAIHFIDAQTTTMQFALL